MQSRQSEGLASFPRTSTRESTPSVQKFLSRRAMSRSILLLWRSADTKAYVIQVSRRYISCPNTDPLAGPSFGTKAYWWTAQGARRCPVIPRSRQGCTWLPYWYQHLAPHHFLKIVASDWTTLGKRVVKNHYHLSVIRNELTRNIGNVFPDLREEIVLAFNDKIPPTEGR